MRQEEGELFPLAREHLTESDWREIEDAFANNKDPVFGEHTHEKYAVLRSRITVLAQPPLGLGGTSATRVKADAKPLLELLGVSAHYGRIAALRSVSMQVGKGQLVALVGSNGAGKTTLLRTISGLQTSSGGRMLFEGRDLSQIKPAQRVAAGIAHVPEGRQVFATLSVEDNLALGAYSRTNERAAVRRETDRIYDIFPVLRDKRKVPAGTLSGGQQQMLAIGRAMMAKPRLMLLDEPSMGLSPLIVSEVFEVINRLQQEGMTILIVEQNAAAVLALADIGYVLESGEITHSGEGRVLRYNEDVKRAYLGI
ncbi:MAG: ABC transporter ATP-binding protein [Marinobacter sp.]|nr:ABC transporter ATP-binding protein [Marinobacter sp.]